VSSEKSFMEKPCQHCPFKTNVKPFLHPDRAADIAYAAQNPYSDFPCHKTLGYVENEEGEEDTARTEESKECAGFLTMRCKELGEEAVHEIKEGFKPAYEDVYEDAGEMADAYEEAWPIPLRDLQ